MIHLLLLPIAVLLLAIGMIWILIVLNSIFKLFDLYNQRLKALQNTIDGLQQHFYTDQHHIYKRQLYDVMNSIDRTSTK